MMKNCMWSFIFFIISSFSSLALLAQTASGDVTNTIVASQDVSFKTQSDVIVCRNNYTEQRPQIIYEDYRQCVFKYINNIFTKEKLSQNSSKKNEYLVFIGEIFSSNFRYYLIPYKNTQIRKILSEKKFVPELFILKTLKEFQDGNNYKLNLQEEDMNTIRNHAKKIFLILKDYKNSKLYIKDFESILTKVRDSFKEIKSKLDKSNDMVTLEKMLIEVETSLLINNLQEDVLSAFRNIVYRQMLSLYSEVNNFEKFETVYKKLDGPIDKEFKFLFRTKLMLKKFDECIAASERVIQNAKMKSSKEEALKQKIYCTISRDQSKVGYYIKQYNSGTLGFSNKEIEKETMAEVFILNNQFEQAEALLKESTEGNNAFRLIDLYSRKKMFDKALSIITENNLLSKKSNNNFFVNLRNELKIFIILYVNKRKNDYIKMLPELNLNCKKIMQLTSERNGVVLQMCSFVDLVQQGIPKEKIKEILTKKTTDYYLPIFKYQLIEYAKDGL